MTTVEKSRTFASLFEKKPDANTSAISEVKYSRPWENSSLKKTNLISQSQGENSSLKKTNLISQGENSSPDRMILISQEDNQTDLFPEEPKRVNFNVPVKNINVPEPNSLEAFIRHLKNELNKRSNLDDPEFNRFKEKFKIATTTKNDDLNWNTMMDKLSAVARDIDTKYKNRDYLGIKQRLIDVFMEIAISWIIIGPTVNSGPGISNLNFTMSRIDQFNKKPTIIQMVNSFLNVLPKKMDCINDIKTYVDNLDVLHEKLINEKIELESKSEILKKNVKTLEKDISKIEYSSNKKRELVKMKDDLNKNSQSLNEIQEQIENKNSNIQRAISAKKDANERIGNFASEGFGHINFSYFLHDDWFPKLDYHILRK
jgi:hypothetical protein